MKLGPSRSRFSIKNNVSIPTQVYLRYRRHAKDIKDIETAMYGIENFINGSTKRLYQLRPNQQLEAGRYDIIEKLYKHIRTTTPQRLRELKKN